MTLFEPHSFLTAVFRAAVDAANPHTVTRQAVARLGNLDQPVWVIAIGKGAHAMATGALEAFRERHVPVAGGLVVSNADDPEATHDLEALLGDHPTPSSGSFEAADRLGAVASKTTPEEDAIVLVSGGATSLIASPVASISESELQESFAALLGSGADIGLMNAVRKRILRFGAGRLALALNTRRIHCLVASDVVGNDLGSIASGPCVPDASSTGAISDRLRALNAWDALPGPVRRLLDEMAQGKERTPAPDDPRFTTTHTEIILDRSHAEQGAADTARELGANVDVQREPLAGDAAAAARRLVMSFLEQPRESGTCTIVSGETTVTLGAKSGLGGRCQEFALAAALQLAESDAHDVTVLAAGTDGRDGPTDAAGAVVDATTCNRIRAGGVDPAEALRTHRSYDALNSANALLKTGPTGTNVNDLVITIHWPRNQ